MEVIKNFGFEPTFFFAQIINFLILAFVFKKFLYKPILKMLQERRKIIAQGLEDAEGAQITLAKAEEKKNALIKTATIEAEKIIDDTKKSVEELRQKALYETRLEAEKIIKEARETAVLEINRAQNEVKRASLDIARQLLNRLLSEIFTKEEKGKILSRNILRLKEYEA